MWEETLLQPNFYYWLQRSFIYQQPNDGKLVVADWPQTSRVAMAGPDRTIFQYRAICTLLTISYHTISIQFVNAISCHRLYINNCF